MTTSSQVWKRPRPLGALSIMRGIGGIVSPLLAGFSLATVAVLVTAASSSTEARLNGAPPLADWAVAGLAIAAVLFLFATGFALLGLRHETRPSDLLDWVPEALKNYGVLLELRIEQAMDQRLCEIYAHRVGRLYHLGIMSLILGLGAMIVPRHWTVGVAVALVALLLGLSLDIWLAFVRRPQALVRRVFPSYDEVREQIVSAVSRVDEASPDGVGNVYASSRDRGLG